jgi:hypothetical protein
MMSPVSGLHRRRFLSSVLVIVCVASTAQRLAAQGIRGLFGGGPVKYRTYKDPSNRFELEYPERDWRLISGGSSLAVFAHKDGPAFFIDHVRLMEALTPGEIGALPEVEVERIKTQNPMVKDVNHEPLETKAGAGILIRYAKLGPGPAASVTQFVIPIGQNLFRLSGTIPETITTKYQPIVMHMIESFQVPGATPAPSPAPQM